jgi:hypothetical protein
MTYSFLEGRDMRLSQRYKELFEALQERLESASRSVVPYERADCYECAQLLQRQCGDIAHCIAMFGDLEIDSLTRTHQDFADGIRCIERHPWRNGLSLVRRDLRR